MSPCLRFVALTALGLLGACEPIELWLGGLPGGDAAPDTTRLDASVSGDASTLPTDDAGALGAGRHDARGADADAAKDAAADAASGSMGGDATMDASADARPGPGADDAGQEPGDASAPETGSTCADNRRNGDETDVDCGGSCPPCAISQKCLEVDDCDPFAPGCEAALGGCVCSSATGRCVKSHCADQGQNVDETDVDCGGSCAGCGPSKDCLVDDDCSDALSGCDPAHGCYCDALSKQCVYSHCFDQKVSGGEPDLDCGSGDCERCELGEACGSDFDCKTNACDALVHECFSNQCIDHHVNGDETDIDCGGSTCGPCGPGLRCTRDFDCQSGFCAGIPKTCQ